MLQRLVFISMLFPALAFAAEPKEFPNYLSIKYGSVQSQLGFENDAKFKNDDGTLKEVEFLWASYTYAKLIGGINLGSKNKFAGYTLGLVFDNKDIISVAQFITDDELLKADRDNGFNAGLTFGRKRAVTTEYTWVFNRTGGDFQHITYGKSNYPATVTVSEEPTAEDDKTFLDPNPSIQYLYFGFEIDPIRAALLDETEFRNLAADWYFLQAKMGFGAYYFELSDTQYSFVYKNENNQYGLANEWGIEPLMGLRIDFGAVTTVSSEIARAIAALSYYYQFPPSAVATKLYKFNTTEAGYHFSADGSPHHGILGRVAASF